MWRLTPGQALRHRQFDQQFVVYNDLSGDTHLLGDAAAHLLSILQQGPADAATLGAALAAALDTVPDAAFEDDTGAVLAQLASLFLIEALPC